MTTDEQYRRTMARNRAEVDALRCVGDYEEADDLERFLNGVEGFVAAESVVAATSPGSPSA